VLARRQLHTWNVQGSALPWQKPQQKDRQARARQPEGINSIIPIADISQHTSNKHSRVSELRLQWGVLPARKAPSRCCRRLRTHLEPLQPPGRRRNYWWPSGNPQLQAAGPAPRCPPRSLFQTSKYYYQKRKPGPPSSGSSSGSTRHRSACCVAPFPATVLVRAFTCVHFLRWAARNANISPFADLGSI
jgi:hypothetical protein